jgi:dodecin
MDGPLTGVTLPSGTPPHPPREASVLRKCNYAVGRCRYRYRPQTLSAAQQLPGRPSPPVPLTRPIEERDVMTNHTYRVIEIVGTSPDSIDAAIRSGLARAAETTRGLDWFDVQSVRGHLDKGTVAHFQVTLKVGFRLEDA